MTVMRLFYQKLTNPIKILGQMHFFEHKSDEFILLLFQNCTVFFCLGINQVKIQIKTVSWHSHEIFHQIRQHLNRWLVIEGAIIFLFFVFLIQGFSF